MPKQQGSKTSARLGADAKEQAGTANCLQTAQQKLDLDLHSPFLTSLKRQTKRAVKILLTHYSENHAGQGRDNARRRETHSSKHKEHTAAKEHEEKHDLQVLEPRTQKTQSAGRRAHRQQEQTSILL